MPKIASVMSPLEVRGLDKAGLHPVGSVPGLCLQVTKSGARSWILRAKVGAHRRDIGLGSFGPVEKPGDPPLVPTVSLADARRLAREAREKIKAGIDPVDSARAATSRLKAEQAKAMTFEDAAKACIASKASGWRNAKHAAQWSATLETYAYPKLGKLLVQHIERSHVLAVLEPIWTTKGETASRVRARIEAVLDYAAQKLDLPAYLNPARYRNNLDKALPSSAKPKPNHHAAVAIDDAPAFMSKLRTMQGTGARALEFTMLTAARTTEVRGALWSEIDLHKGLWTIPGERMKAGRPHVVPLSTAAVELLNSLPRVDDADLVFPAADGETISINTMRSVMTRMGMDEVPHGLRSTFRDWASERTNVPHEVAEMALAHAVRDKTEAAYRRGDLLTKRAALMQQWADFLSAPNTGATVVPIAAAPVGRAA